MTAPPPARVTPRLTPSAVVLVAANLVPLAGVLFFGWTVFATLLLFWVENAIVGAFNVLRMLTAEPEQVLPWIGKAFVIPFFIVHYGMFVTVHGLFVLSLFGGPTMAHASPTPATFVHAIRSAGIMPAALALLLSHGVSFAFNYIGAGEYKTAQPGMLMFRPYGRVMVLHVVILGGGFLVATLGSQLLPLALLVILKTGLDLRGHLKEHAGPGQAGQPGSASAA